MVNFEEYNWDYTDECLLSKFKEKIAAVKKRTGNLSITTLEDYYALPLIPTYDTRGFYIGGLCSEKGSLHSSSKVLPVRVFNSYCFNPEDAIYDDREVIFAGCFWLHWGHFILEQVSRLYYFLNEKDSSLPIIYLADRPLTGNFLEFFDLLGIDTSRLIWVNKITKFRKIIIPEVSVVTRDYWYEEYKQIFEKIKSNVVTRINLPKKIFLTRRNFKKAEKIDYGEIREIEDFFVEQGYTLISPETLTLKEQVQYLKSCEEIVAISGTLPHNFVFADKNCKTIILNRTCLVNTNQPLIDDVTGLRPTNIDVHLSIYPVHRTRGLFYYYISDNLVKWAKDNGMVIEKINTRNFLKTYAFENLKLLFKNPNAFNVAMPYKIFDYYYNILKKENIFYLDIKFAGKLVELFYKTKNLKRKYRFLKTIIVSKCLIKGINLEKF